MNISLISGFSGTEKPHSLIPEGEPHSEGKPDAFGADKVDLPTMGEDDTPHNEQP